MSRKINIAIDGYSSCGKSTLAKQMARELNYIYVDTGAMYRAVTLFAVDSGIIEDGVPDVPKLKSRLKDIEITFVNNSKNKPEVHLNGENVESRIRQMSISNNVSAVAAIKEVRKLLVAQQQKMGEKKGVVMDGRDIGTVVFPDAELKIFMTASHEVRTERRYQELMDKGDQVTKVEVSENLKKRDHIDTTRKEDPLRQADDAVVLDNSKLSKEKQLALALEWASNRINE